jgi:hypothetical protein
MQWISAIIAIFKAIPILDKYFKDLVLAYGAWKVESFDKDFNKAWLKMIAEKDQRLLEETLGMRAGPPRDMDGVITRPRKP